VNDDLATVGTITGGAVMEQDVMVNFIASGREIPWSNPWIKPDNHYITLIIDDPFASWALSVEISHAVNQELALQADAEGVALAVDSKNIVVLVPPFQQNDPGTWIRDILSMSLLVPATEAKISIDKTAGTLAVVGDATISPVVISHRGLTVTVTNPDTDDAGAKGTRAREVIEQTFLNLGSDRGQGAKVDDLLDSLNQLRIPIDDRIAIIENIHRLGKLHAKIVYQD
jgi:flagellar basal body P-ring protein FlgI